jgi:hypothetical protein
MRMTGDKVAKNLGGTINEDGSLTKAKDNGGKKPTVPAAGAATPWEAPETDWKTPA